MYENTFKSLLNRFFIIVFCFRQQPFCSTELNSTSETKHGSSTTFETGLNDIANYMLSNFLFYILARSLRSTGVLLKCANLFN